jgi:sugar (pentulose or hexulose) kinase
VWPRILSEVTGLRLELVNGQAAGAMGAAALAGIGVGVFPGEREAAARLAADAAVISPAKEAVREYAALFERYCALPP